MLLQFFVVGSSLVFSYAAFKTNLETEQCTKSAVESGSLTGAETSSSTNLRRYVQGELVKVNFRLISCASFATSYDIRIHHLLSGTEGRLRVYCTRRSVDTGRPAPVPCSRLCRYTSAVCRCRTGKTYVLEDLPVKCWHLAGLEDK